MTLIFSSLVLLLDAASGAADNAVFQMLGKARCEVRPLRFSTGSNREDYF
jgi:hypothetical protein